MRAARLLPPAFFAVTLFLSSFLLFVIEPMQGKVLLPIMGGTPSVWTGCMVFFQAVLLLGYLYAHFLSKLKVRTQLMIHAVVVLLPLALLPPALPEFLIKSPLLTGSPLLWLVYAMSLSIGPVFFTLSSTSPLLQSWFFRSNHSGAANPYPLYAAGNLGSLLALLGYPFVVEPMLHLAEQEWIWSRGYLALSLCVLGAGVWLCVRVARAAPPAPLTEAEEDELDLGWALRDTDVIPEYEEDLALDGWMRGTFSGSMLRRLQWILLAFVPSSLMLGVTTFLTTDIASIPLLWMLPLLLYILSFVIVFAKWSARADALVTRTLPLAVAPVIFLVFADFRDRMWLVMTFHLFGFFMATLACHGRLARLRPEPKRLTEFFFFLSLGGVLGGLFNALIAPNIFDSVAEYPLVLAASVLVCLPVLKLGAEKPKNMLVATLASCALFVGLSLYNGYLYNHAHLDAAAQWLEAHTPLPWEFEVVRSLLLYGVPVVLALFLVFRQHAYGGAILGVAMVALFNGHNNIIHQERSFFGVLTVKEYEDPPVHSLVHGGIMHGEQRLDTDIERETPRSYYHKDGPLGQIWETIEKNVEKPRIAAVGLGTGSIAAYGTPKNYITFYELDPNVERLSRNRDNFTYVDDCIKRWCNLKVVLGDGRLRLAEAEETYDLIILDAFSSDAIPIHLLTLEAMNTYLAKLNENGFISFHISNRYINLEPVLLNLAQKLGLGYAVRSDDAEEKTGKGASTWVVLAKDGAFFEPMVEDDRWRGLEPKDGIGLWADDYANVTRAFTIF